MTKHLQTRPHHPHLERGSASWVGRFSLAVALCLVPGMGTGQTATTHKAPKATVHRPGSTPHQSHTTSAHHVAPAVRSKTSSHSTHTLPSRTSRAAVTVRPSAPISHFPTISPTVTSSFVSLPPMRSPFYNAKALAPFFEALAAHQRESASATPNPNASSPVPAESSTVRILQFGDSHTAADLFTGALRSDLQTRFGDGGLGFQYPGHPFAGYHLAGSARSQSPGWLTEGNHFTQLGDGDLGMGGISLTTTRPGEWISLATSCTTLQVHFLRQAGGGRLRFTDNGGYVSDIDTNSDANPGSAEFRSAGTFTYACTSGEHQFELTTEEHAPVRLLGMVTEQPGITYECIGINGAVATLMLRWNQTLFSEYLRQRDPTLIVLAYGTNEAAGSAAHNEEYVQDFNRLLDNLHTYVPSAAVLVLGPYDRATRIGRGRRAAWQTWAGTERIIEDQREACRTHNCAFYDSRARMGGPGTMLHWAANGLAQADRTHLTGTGYRTMADALYNDLLTAYKPYEPATTTATSTTSSSGTSSQP